MTVESAKDVILTLLNAAGEIRYPAGVKSIPSTLEQLLPGFSPFPFGCGLIRRGTEWPDFPVSPYLVLLHNWGDEKMLRDARQAGGEDDAVWWRKRLRPVLAERGIRLADCFFSNALMGLKTDGERCGEMSSNEDYHTDCQKFLRFQLARIKPRAVIHCGVPCADFCTAVYSTIKALPFRHSSIMHPSSRPVSWGGLTVEQWIKREASKIELVEQPTLI